MKLIPPDEEAIREAKSLAEDLLSIATGAKADNWDRFGPNEIPLSQSDRLVIVTGRLGRIAELLRWRCVNEDGTPWSPPNG